MEVDSTEEERGHYPKGLPKQRKESSETAPQGESKHAEQSGSGMSHAPSIGEMMNPKKTWKDEMPSVAVQDMKQMVSQILGVQPSDWPYSRDSFDSLISLKIQQETVKAEQARARDLELSMKLLEQAHSVGIPPGLIPYLFLFSRTESQSFARLISDWERGHTGDTERPHGDTVGGPSASTGPPGSTGHTGPTSTGSTGLGIRTPEKNPQFAPAANTGRAVQHTPGLVVASVPVEHAVSQRSGSGVRRQQQQPTGSPFRRSHQRSHTISGMTGTTSVWKVNLPQQQQFQFHHWSGPGDNEDENRKSRLGHSRTSSRSARQPDDASIDSPADLSLVSETASPTTSTKRKLDSRNESAEAGFGGTEAVFSLQPRRGLHSRGESITVTGGRGMDHRRSPEHKKSRSDVTGFPPAVSGQYPAAQGAVPGPYMYRYPQYGQPSGGPYYNQRYPGYGPGIGSGSGPGSGPGLEPGSRQGLGFGPGQGLGSASTQGTSFSQSGPYYAPQQPPYYYRHSQQQMQPQQRSFPSYRFPPNATPQTNRRSPGATQFVFSNQRNSPTKPASHDRDSGSSSSTNATTLSMSSARRTSAATSKDAAKKK
ncbi:hypothetical protein BRETT_001768 [Brettanomyces bruxellensis]|uniref:Uncharacterized protein n=1 Tax=Dekkera bruxellensis TaxID=5007 RepID=A0A871R9A5_DEKBR|nr:uncharacterized protein BRETT_001768 [Brettanomyces bruxellensis]QOU18700.1 hypothetical protein BRETT_001768 [Brettanomyces bruxellensis]